MNVKIYVCPNSQCGNYYGSSSMPILENEMNMAPITSRDRGQVRSTRATCPQCGSEREPWMARLVYQIKTPLEGVAK